MRLQRGRKLRALRLLNRDEVLDTHRVQRLPSEALGHHAGANALARGVDRCRGAGRSAADDQHVEGFLCAQLGGIARRSAGIDLGQDVGDLDAARMKHLAVQKHHWHSHDLARLDLGLEQAAVNGDVADARVQHRHQVERLHHVGAVVAAQGHVGLEDEVAVVVSAKRADLLDHIGLDLGRVPASLQQRQDQRRELMAHGNGGETHAHVRPHAADRERWATRVLAVMAHSNLVAELADLVEQLAHLLRGGSIVERGHQFHRMRHALEVGLELGLEVVVQHGGNPSGLLSGRVFSGPVDNPHTDNRRAVDRA